ncbi:MAG: malonyl-CoA synthase [Silicimonas sp.]|nr:malonyl-CoA synthase [Silicimonas sp.]
MCGNLRKCATAKEASPVEAYLFPHPKAAYFTETTADAPKEFFVTNHLYDTLFGPQSNNSGIFLETGDEDQPISFSAFCSRAATMAHTLVKHGVKPGDRVAVQAHKRPEMLELYAATIQCGAVFLPLNTAYTRDELTYFLTDATPRVFVCDNRTHATLSDMLNTLETEVLTLNTDGSGSLADGSRDNSGTFPTVQRGPDDLAALMYTSGTTGRSKGAMLTHDNIASNARVLTQAWHITRDDRLIHALPIFHTHGLFVAINTALLAGASVMFMDRFDLDRIIGALPEATLMMGVPTFYTRLLQDNRLTRDQVRNMRLFISGSAPLLAETHDAFAARTGHRILERYGMSETNMITSNPYDGERIAGTVGLPLRGIEVRLANAETGAEISDGFGVIEVRGPNVFKGYWNMPEKTAEELRPDGFFITGDLGQIDERGYLSIVGRQKDLIITGGYNVYPKEIEDVLNRVDGIRESAVFGLPDADFGERIVAAVVLETPDALDAEVLRTQVADKLARFKHPNSYVFLEALPRNSMGKVQKNVLRDTLSGGFPTTA